MSTILPVLTRSLVQMSNGVTGVNSFTHMTIVMPFGSLDGVMIHIMLINQRSHFSYTFLSEIKKSFLLFQLFSCHIWGATSVVYFLFHLF